MKTKSFIAMSMIAALAAGCSSDDIVDGVEDTNGGTEVTTNGTAFVSLNITLPSEAGTRSANNNFEHGTANEYNVKKIKITYYQEATGGEILDTKEYTSSDLAWEKPTTPADGITTKALLPVDEVKFSGNAYALVEVNTPDGLTVNYVNNEAQTVTASTLIGGGDGFFMTNTVMENGTVLVPVHSYAKKTEAQEHAGEYNIYVERAVAKVDLNVKGGDNWLGNIYTIASGVNNGAQVRIDKWQLDITNTKMFPIRKFAAASYDKTAYARFFSGFSYRTYWAEDPNYNNYDYYLPNSTEHPAVFDTISSVREIQNAIGNCEYCLENTFNVEHQKQNETTRALVKATFLPKELTNIVSLGTTWYTLGNSTKGYTKDQVEYAIAAAAGVDGTQVSLNELAAGTTDFNDQVFTLSGTNLTEDMMNAVKNRLGKITTYVNGECYYAIRIKHLDHYCPWGDDSGAPTEFGGSPYVDYVYSGFNQPDLEIKYLGRYGVVRNNWYKITINTVSQPGSPTMPARTMDPDDEQKYYLQATINIQDWAVRNQGVDL